SLTEGLHLSRLAQKFGSGRDQKVLAVVGMNVTCQKAFDGCCKLPVEPVNENSLEYGSFKENIGLAGCRGRRRHRDDIRAAGFLLFCFFRGTLLRWLRWERRWRRRCFEQFGGLDWPGVCVRVKVR